MAQEVALFILETILPPLSSSTVTIPQGWSLRFKLQVFSFMFMAPPGSTRTSLFVTFCQPFCNFLYAFFYPLQFDSWRRN